MTPPVAATHASWPSATPDWTKSGQPDHHHRTGRPRHEDLLVTLAGQLRRQQPRCRGAGETRAHAGATGGLRKCLTGDRVFLRPGARWTAVRGSALGEAGSMADRGPAEIAALNQAIAALEPSHRLRLRPLSSFLVGVPAIAHGLGQGSFACPRDPWTFL